MIRSSQRLVSCANRFTFFACAGLLAITGVVSSGCSQTNSYDTYLEGMRAEGAAERGVCRLMFDSERKSYEINAGQISACVSELKRAQSLYLKAGEQGQTGFDFKNKLEKIQEQIKKLATMQRMLTKMEAGLDL